MSRPQFQMNFCRRCGSPLSQKGPDTYNCQKGHVIFYNAPSAVGVVFCNDLNEVLMLERAIQPGKGMLDIPGGFCIAGELAEDAAIREAREETGLLHDDFSELAFMFTHVDPYEYRGETLPVLALIFKARVVKDIKLRPADDAASAKFIPIHDIDTQKIHFPSIKKAIRQLQASTRGSSAVQ